MSKLRLSRRTPVGPDLGPTLLQCDLSLARCLCYGPASKQSHALRVWGVGLQHLNLGRTQFSPYQVGIGPARLILVRSFTQEAGVGGLVVRSLGPGTRRLSVQPTLCLAAWLWDITNLIPHYDRGILGASGKMCAKHFAQRLVRTELPQRQLYSANIPRAHAGRPPG